MVITLGRAPSAIASALGGIDLGERRFAVSPAVAAILRALGAMGSQSADLLAQDSTPIANEDGVHIIRTE